MRVCSTITQGLSKKINSGARGVAVAGPGFNILGKWFQKWYFLVGLCVWDAYGGSKLHWNQLR